MANLPTFPKFDGYSCVGDYRLVDVGPYTIRATLEHDGETSPSDFDCYSPDDVESWNRDEWRYVGIVLSVYVGPVRLVDHAASIWGTDCNFPGSDNAHLSELANDMLPEAIAEAKAVGAAILEKLNA